MLKPLRIDQKIVGRISIIYVKFFKKLSKNFITIKENSLKNLMKFS